MVKSKDKKAKKVHTHNLVPLTVKWCPGVSKAVMISQCWCGKMKILDIKVETVTAFQLKQLAAGI